MRKSKRYTVLELGQMEKIKKTGELYGDSVELKTACEEAYQLYRSRKISTECYDRIYSYVCDNYLKLS